MHEMIPYDLVLRFPPCDIDAAPHECPLAKPYISIMLCPPVKMVCSVPTLRFFDVVAQEFDTVLGDGWMSS